MKDPRTLKQVLVLLIPPLIYVLVLVSNSHTEQRLRTPRRWLPVKAYGAGKKKCPECGGKGCSHCGDTGFHKMKKEDVDILDEKKGLYANIHAKENAVEHPQNQDRKIILQRTLSRRAQRLQRRKKFRLNSMARLTSLKEREVVEEGSMKQARKNVGFYLLEGLQRQRAPR